MSQIKLLHSGGNGVSIVAPDSNPASDRTLKLPSDGDSTIDTLSRAGNILQVKQTVKLDSFSTTSTTAVDITGLSVDITPTSTSSKILVMVSLPMGNDDANFTYGVLKRGSTQLGEADGASNRPRPTYMAYDSNEGILHMVSFTFLDSPNTTSATTYKMQLQCASTGTATVGKSFRDNDNVGHDPRMSSTITVMEVAA